MRRLLIALTLACCLLPMLARAQTENRILGGEYVPPTRWPMVVAVLFGGAPGCGGTLISESVVLTAAHCVVQDGKPLPISVLSVRFGTEWLDSRAGEVVDVAEVVAHQDYRVEQPGTSTDRDYGYFVNDIALLRLVRPVTFAPAALLGPHRAPTLGAPGASAVATGWGGATILKQVDLTISADAACAARTAPRPDTPDMMCAAPAPATVATANATCGNDAGSPLFLPNGRGGFVLAGILSVLQTDCAQAAPAIVTRTTAYLDWITARVPGIVIDDSLIESGFWSLDGAGGAAAAIEIQGGRLILGLALYDKAGSPTWYLASGPFAGSGSFTAPLGELADGSDMLYAAGPRHYRELASPGNVTVTFGATDQATLVVGDRRWTIRRMTWNGGRPAPAIGLPETGWYWSRRDPGRFWFIEGQGDRLLVGDFAYGTVRVDDHFPARWTIAQGTAAKVGTAAVMSAPIFGCVGGQGLATASGTATCGDTDFALSLTFPGVFAGWLIPGGERAVAVGRYMAP